ncbi:MULTISPECIES: substrate-binding periplasmic protein [unclassified Agarivorans]|uniref:substrate-binding periplasmic protein n=1 Tax=unclassified Agarivorans TaxID=2636026 RepID=UPI003D7D4EEC
MRIKLLLLIWLCCSNIALSVATDKPGMLLVTEEWAPFNYQENGKLVGFSTEIVAGILKLLNEDYQIQLLPSLRSTRVLNSRPQTMMFSLFRTPSREQQYKWIGPLSDGSIYFYKRRGHRIPVDSLADLKRVKRIATRHQGIIPSLLLEQGFENLDMTATSSMQVYQKLLLGRADIAISDTDLGVSHNMRMLAVDMRRIEKIPIQVFRSDLYIAAHKDLPDSEIQRWQAALDTLKANGSYQAIFDKYMQTSLATSRPTQ